MAELVNLSMPETQQSNNRDPRHCEGLETQEEKIILHSSTRSLFESDLREAATTRQWLHVCGHVRQVQGCSARGT